MKRGVFRLALLGLSALTVGCTAKTFDIGEVELLEVTSVDPHDGAVDVPRNAAITVVFSLPVAVASLTREAGGVELLLGVDGADPQPVGFTPELDTTLKTLTVVTGEPLVYGQTYTLRLTTLIERQDRNGFLVGEVVSMFTVEDAPEPFEVVSVWPPHGEVEVPLFDADEKPITPMVSFNHRADVTIDPGDHLEVNDVAGGLAIAGTWSFSEFGQRITFTPEDDWDFGQEVRVRVRQGMPDAYTGSLADDVAFSFTFAFQAAMPFEVLSHFPLADQEGVLREDASGAPAEIVISFSDPVDDSADWASHLSVTDQASQQAVPGAWRLDAATSSAIFAPSGAWDFDQAVEVMVTSGLLGIGRGALEEDYGFAFTFESPPLFYPVSVYPPIGKDDVQPLDDQGEPIAIEIFFNEPPADIAGWQTRFEAHDVTVPANEIDLKPSGELTINETNASVVFRLDPGETWRVSQSVRLRLLPGLQGVSGGTFDEQMEGSFTFSSPTALLIMRTEPPDGGVRIPLIDAAGGDKRIGVFFNEPLDTSQSWAPHFVVETIEPGGPTPVAGSWALGPGDQSTEFTPDGPWSFGQEVQLTVVSGLLGFSGSALVRDRVIGFTFEAPPPLVVISVDPADGAERVPRSDAGQPTSIRVVFSEGLNPATVTLGDSFRIVDELGDPIDGARVLAETAMADDTVVFTPAAPWSYSQAVQVIAGYALESVRGATLGASAADDVVSGFLFEDPPPLLMVSRYPAADAPDVLTNTDLTWKFSRAVDQGSVTEDNLKVWLDSDAGENNLCTIAAGTVSFDISDTTIFCDPAVDLPAGDKVWVALAAGPAGLKASDATSRGGWLDEQTVDLIYSFDVKAAPELGIVSVFPPADPAGDPARDVDPRSTISVVFDRAVDRTSVDPSSFRVRECNGPAPCPDVLDGTELPASQACGGGVNCIAFSRDDLEVNWTHATRLQYQTFYTVVLADTIVSADGVAERPPGDYVFSFETTPPPTISVLQTEPDPGAANLTRRPTVRILYNMAIDAGTLLVDSAGGDGYIPNVFINRGTATDRDAELVYGSDYTLEMDDVDRVRLNLLRNLTLGESYTVTSTLDLRNVETGGLVSPHHFVFSIRSESLLESLSPPDNATDVPVAGTSVRAVFREDMEQTTINESTFGLTFTDRFGRLHPVPGSVAYEAGTRTATFTPSESSVGHCARGGDWPLIYDSRYQVRLSPRIASAAGETLGAVSAGFTTMAAPGVSGIRSEGVKAGSADDDRAALDGAVDVPQSSTLFVEFSEAMDPASFVASPVPVSADTVTLEYYPPVGEPQVPTRVPVNVAYAGLTLTVTPEDLLEQDRRHVLRLKGKDLGHAAWASNSSGQPLPATVEASFHVATALQANLTLVRCLPCCHTECHWSGDPPREEPWQCDSCDCPAECKPPVPSLPDLPPNSLEGEAPFAGGVISAIFNRPVPRLEIESAFAVEISSTPRVCSFSYPEISGPEPDLVQSVTCTPAGGIAVDNVVRIVISGALEDAHGNPLLAPIIRDLEPAVAAPVDAGDPQVYQLNVAGLPVALGTVKGDQIFRVVFGATVPDYRIDASTVHGGSSLVDSSDASIAMFNETEGDAFVPVQVIFQPQQNWLFQLTKPDPTTNPIPMDQPDYADFTPVLPLEVGDTYRIEVDGAMIRTLAGLGLDSNFSDTVSVEADPPTLDAMQIRRWHAGLSEFYWTDGAGLTDVPADTSIRLEFSEKLDMGSAQSEILLQEQGASILPIAMTLEDPQPDPGFGLILTPDAPLSAGVTYEVMVTPSLLDITGQSKGAQTVLEFTVDDAPMTVSSVSPTGLGVPLDAEVSLSFSDPVDPLTLHAGDTADPATVWLEHVTEQGGLNPCSTLRTGACVSFTPDLRTVFLTPVGPGLVPHRTYDVKFDVTEVTDLGGASLDPAYGPLQFETIAGPPTLLCTIPGEDELFTLEDPIELHFTEEVLLVTLEDHTRLVHRETGLEANTEIAAMAEAGSYTFTPSPGEPLERAAIYSLEVGHLVLDAAAADNLYPPHYVLITTHGLVINELLYDPLGVGGAWDVNCDGTTDESDDEFVELYNMGNDPVDISDWTLQSATLGLRHTFADGTTIPAGGALLIFGGGTPGLGCFPGVDVVVADSGLDLDLVDTLWLMQDRGLVVDVAAWDDAVGINQSWVRDPEGTGDFRAHSGAAGSGGAEHSAGTRTDGSPF